MLRNDRGRRLARIRDSIDASIQILEVYIKKRGGRLITVTRKEYWQHKHQQNKNRRKILEEKQLYGHFKRQTSDFSHEKIWTWQRKRNLSRETGFLLIAALKNAIRTNQVKARIDKTQQNRCRLCGDRDETINHVISEHSKFEQIQYKISKEIYF